MVDTGSRMEFFKSLTLLIFVTSDVNSHLNRKTGPIQLQPHTWICLKNGRCIRDDFSNGSFVLDTESYSYLEGCKSVCGHYGALWPKPTGHVELSKNIVPFLFDDLSMKLEIEKGKDRKGSEDLEDMLTQAWSIFAKNIQNLFTSEPASYSKFVLSKHHADSSKKLDKKSQVLVRIKVSQTDLGLTLKTDESYSLAVILKPSEATRDQVEVDIVSKTFFGARHGLETLSQLITYDTKEKSLRLPSQASVSDAPIFPFRGLLIDTGRNYFSIDSLKRIIDGLSYNKMNVLHWHMNEQQSFPFVSQRVPELSSYGAYSERYLYYMDEVKSLASYSLQRGVLLLPEFDAPAHASYGWQTWPQEKGLGNFTTCMNNIWKDEFQSFAAEPPSGQLNPANEKLYDVLGEVYKDFIESFLVHTGSSKPNHLSMFHMGGDEVNFQCWYQEKSIRDWMINNHFEVNPSVTPEGYLKLWATFQEKALQKLVKANGDVKFKDGIILWTSELTKPDKIFKYVDKDTYVIQVWTSSYDSWISDLLHLNYRLILSNHDAWYLDCGYGAWLYSGSNVRNNWCSPFKDWKVMYENSPRDILQNFGLEWSKYGSLILGGEAALWSEQVDEFSGEVKIWPRTCAVAERLWSDPIISGKPYDPSLSPDEASYQANWWSEPERRLLEHHRRMVRVRGLRADAMQPEFCRQHDGACYNVPRASVPIPEMENYRGSGPEDGLGHNFHDPTGPQSRFPMSLFRNHSVLFLAVTLIVLLFIIRRRWIVATSKRFIDLLGSRSSKRTK